MVSKHWRNIHSFVPASKAEVLFLQHKTLVCFSAEALALHLARAPAITFWRFSFCILDVRSSSVASAREGAGIWRPVKKEVFAVSKEHKNSLLSPVTPRRETHDPTQVSSPPPLSSFVFASAGQDAVTEEG